MGSSGSKGTSANQVGAFNFNSLLQRVQEQTLEIKKLQAENKSQKHEIAKLKSQIEELRIKSSILPTVPPPLSEKSLISHVIDPGDTESSHSNLPKVDDHVVSMWGESKWQYFTATIVEFHARTLKYTIEWDDGDPTGRLIDYHNLALDKVPPADLIGVGSKVLFHQGSYNQQQVHGVSRSGGLRWHQGIITKTSKAPDGTKRYKGKHTKGADDGKWITYKDYSTDFSNYKIEDFRMPPNKFDLLDSVSAESTGNAGSKVDDEAAIDVFISFAKVNSPSAINNNEINRSDLPPSYEEVVIEDLCDPREIMEKLKSMGVRVHFTEDENDDSNLLKTVSALKRAKVFIACLSDEYASNENCRMEFQYAKKTMRIPVIPIVVGTGSFQWKMTVVGLLIAGELYIHFKDRSVEGFKMNELIRAVKKHIPELQLKNMQYAATGDATLDLITTPGLTLTGSQLETAKASIFFSYCWSNSTSAFENNQVSKAIGNTWNDPRKIAQRLKEVTNAVVWVDVKRLESAADGMGMFGQIATGITDCKVIVACVSNEYAESDNCRMELQFAASSLQKPVTICIVGEGSKWKETVVGKVAEMRSNATISMQELSNSEQFESKIATIAEDILKIEGLAADVETQVAEKAKKNKLFKKKKRAVVSREPTSPSGDGSIFNAPMLGDHVVCLHQAWAYFMSTVVEFDPTDLMYTVDWDDGDTSGRVQSYKDVALDIVPDSSQIGVGSIVLFPQGAYAGTEGNNIGGLRYHQGKITDVRTDQDGETRYDGVHTKRKDDGKWVEWSAYNPSFNGLKLEEFRVSPNAMDALMACRQAFNLGS